MSLKYRAVFGAFAIFTSLSANAFAQGKPAPADDGDEEVEEEQPQANATEPAAPDIDLNWVEPTDQLIPATPQRIPSYGYREEWSILPYGYARLDAIEDSTQSFEGGIGANMISRVGTYRGDHRRTMFTARDSRLGIQIGAPSFPDITPMKKGFRTTGQLEFDFFGLAPTDAKRHDTVVFGPMRIRLAYLKLDTYIVDIVAGQYYELFGWGGHFYPGTVAYLGVPGMIYHRSPQLRIERKFRSDNGNLELHVAVAAVAPGQRDSGTPDGQAGIKLAYKGWKTAATTGFGAPALVPLSIGVSGIYRRFEVPAFRPQPGSESVSTQGYGVAASLMLPIIPVSALYDKSNALTLTGEFSIGTGIADMYTGMDGGSRFPLLPNPSMSAPAIDYPSSVDPGLVTFNRDFALKTINWQAFVAGAQYILPIGNGRVWLTGVYSRAWSNNIKALTPSPSWGAIFTKMEYFDGNLGIEITPAIVLGLSLQSVKQTFADVSAPTPVYGATVNPTLGIPVVPGTGGVPASARNNRGQLTMALFF